MSEMCVLEWEIANNRKPEVAFKDFISIGAFTVSKMMISVPYNSPWKTIEDLVRDAKANPGKYTYSSGGMYRIAHINTELFAKALGLKFRHVPYPGGGPSITAIVGGHQNFSSLNPSAAGPLIKGNKIRALAVQGDTRLSFISDVPTLKEALGIDGAPQISGLGFPRTHPSQLWKSSERPSSKCARISHSGLSSRPRAMKYITLTVIPLPGFATRNRRRSPNFLNN